MTIKQFHAAGCRCCDCSFCFDPGPDPTIARWRLTLGGFSPASVCGGFVGIHVLDYWQTIPSSECSAVIAYRADWGVGSNFYGINLQIGQTNAQWAPNVGCALLALNVAVLQGGLLLGQWGAQYWLNSSAQATATDGGNTIGTLPGEACAASTGNVAALTLF